MQRVNFRIALLCLLLCVGIIGCCFCFLLPQFRKTTERVTDGIPVPDLVGKQYGVATFAPFIAIRNFVVREDLAEGTILAQSPDAGVYCQPEHVLYLTISTRKAGIPLPDVVGLSPEVAKTTLAARGIAAKCIGDGDHIVRTEPQAGTLLFTGESVTLILEQSRRALPDVVGLSLERAKEVLTASGFSVTDIKRIPHAAAEGTVLAATPSEDGGILLTVSEKV